MIYHPLSAVILLQFSMCHIYLFMQDDISVKKWDYSDSTFCTFDLHIQDYLKE